MLPGEVVGREPRDDVAEACPALGRRHVRRALCQRVNLGVSLAKRLFTCAEAPEWILGRVVGGRVDEPARGSVERRHLRRGDVVEAPGEVHAPVVGGVGQKVPVGVAEDARIIEHGGAFVERAELLRVPELTCDAASTRGGIGVAAAERKGVDDVRGRACDAGGKESRRG